jgi:hypothetical protein
LVAGVIVVTVIVLVTVDWTALVNRTGLFADTPEKLAAKLQSRRNEFETALAASAQDQDKQTNLPKSFEMASDPNFPPSSAPKQGSGDSDRLAENMQIQIDEFKQRHGKDHVLLLKITGRIPSITEFPEYFSRILKLTGPSRDNIAHTIPGAGYFGVTYSGDMESIAKQIDFAEVLSTDSDSRTITIKIAAP